MATIYVFVLGDRTEKGFRTEESLEDYLRRGLFEDNGCRFRYNQKRDADLIVLSRGGWVFGHLEVESTEPPNEDDLRDYPPVT